MHRPPPRRRSSSRVLAGLVLALFAVGWLADRAHSTLEPHAWCEEHQRVEHVDSEASACAPAADHCASGDEHGPSIEPFDTDTSQHAACCVLLARSDDPVTVPNARVAPAWILVAARLVPPLAHDAPLVSSVPLLALAPKQSPPAV